MNELDDVYNAEYAESVDAVDVWVQAEYTTNFSQFFTEQRELYERVKSQVRPISDEDLEAILVDIPLQLFSAAESINAYRLRLETIKLKYKERESKFVRLSSEKTDAKKKEDAQLKMIEDKLLITSVTSVITRVENEISFSRELIMSAKKLWDSRRRSEVSNPVSPINVDNLPDYN